MEGKGREFWDGVGEGMGATEMEMLLAKKNDLLFGHSLNRLSYETTNIKELVI